MLLSCGGGNCIVSLSFVCEVVALIGRGGNTGAIMLNEIEKLDEK